MEQTKGVVPLGKHKRESGRAMAIVFVVEDEEQVRVLAESFLEQAGHEVLSAGTLAEARAIITAEEPFDLLFTDMTLLNEPEGGLQLALEAAKQQPGRPVLYTTGRGVTDGMIALFVKPNGFLAKPYTGDQLLTAVRELLPNNGPRS
jgi:DNA-binding NtrC family response regulator